MTIVEMAGRCTAAGLPCDRNKVNRLIASGMLAPGTGGGSGRSNSHDYPESTLLRLLVILKLGQPWPEGFGVSRQDSLRQWIGNASTTQKADDYIAVVAYVLGVPGIDTEQARRPAESLFREQVSPGEDYRRQIDKLLESGAPVEAMGLLYPVSGMSVGARRELYEQSEFMSQVTGEPSLLGGAASLMNEVKSPTRPPYRQLEAQEAAGLGYLCNPEIALRAFNKASQDTLKEAARLTSILLGRVKPPKEPYAAYLVLGWVLFTSLVQDPTVRTALPKLEAGFAQLLALGELNRIGEEADRLVKACTG